VESNAVDIATRTREAENQVVDLLHSLGCDEVSVSSVIRLGSRKDGPTDAPRPLKLVIGSEEQRDKLIRSAKNLKGNQRWLRVWLHPDLTRHQRERRHQLVTEMRQRQEAGERDLIIVGNNRIVKRRKAVEEVAGQPKNPNPNPAGGQSQQKQAD